MTAVEIRRETPAEFAAIRAITAAAFAGKAYSDGTEQELTDALRESGELSLSLVAVEDGSVVGHAALSPVRYADAADWYGLGPVSVRPDRQRSGIGSALLEVTLTWLAEQRAAGCIVIGDPAYYGRFGFRSDGKTTYGSLNTAYVQRLVLNGPDQSGEVVFSPAFGSAG